MSVHTKPNHSSLTLICATHPPTCRPWASPCAGNIVFIKPWLCNQVLPHSDDSECFPDEGIIVQRQSELHSEPSVRPVGAQQDRRETYGRSQQHIMCRRSGAVGLVSSHLTWYRSDWKTCKTGLQPILSPHAGHVAAAGTDGMGGCGCQARAWRCQGRHEGSRCSMRGPPDLVPSIR